MQGVGGTGVALRYILFFFIFYFGPFNISKIKWTKSEEKRNFRGRWGLDLVSGPAEENPGYASVVPRPPQSQTRGGAPAIGHACECGYRPLERGLKD